MSKPITIPQVKVGSAEKKFLLEQIPKFENRKILILGDVGVDEYVMGEVRRISPEAPVPVLEVGSEDRRLGLAANVAQNIRSLGGTPYLVSVVGKDAGAHVLRDLFKQVEVSIDHLIIDESRPTTRKLRVMAKHHHLVRVDFEVRKYITQEVQDRVFKKVESLIKDMDAVILEDYSKGSITQDLIKRVIELAHKNNKKVYLDPHQSTPGDFYQGVDLIKPNFDEAISLSGLKFDDLKDHPNKVIEVGRALQKRTGAKEVVMTRGKDGMLLFSGDELKQVPTFARQVFDVTGAGDTVIAAIALGLASGMTLEKSCMLANFAAGVVVGQVGCVPCTVDDLINYINTTDV